MYLFFLSFFFSSLFLSLELVGLCWCCVVLAIERLDVGRCCCCCCRALTDIRPLAGISLSLRHNHRRKWRGGIASRVSQKPSSRYLISIWEIEELVSSKPSVFYFKNQRGYKKNHVESTMTVRTKPFDGQVDIFLLRYLTWLQVCDLFSQLVLWIPIG